MVDMKWVSYFKKERHLVRLFRERGACSPDLAVTPAGLDPNWANYRTVLNRLISSGAVVRVFDNMVYLDEQKLLQMRMNRIKWALVGLLSISLFFMGLLLRW